LKIRHHSGCSSRLHEQWNSSRTHQSVWADGSSLQRCASNRSWWSKVRAKNEGLPGTW